nr:MAG TPA: hypothetical protein [Caudoviricetes sp.]
MASVLPCFTDSKKICPVCGAYIKALEEYREAVEIMDQLGIDAETKFYTEAMYTYRASEARAGRYFSFAKIGRYEAKSLARFACSASNKQDLLADIEEADMIFKDLDATKRLLYLVKDGIVTKTKY